jgi:chemotaxis protein CheY-P-specific phosphatase CheC
MSEKKANFKKIIDLSIPDILSKINSISSYKWEDLSNEEIDLGNYNSVCSYFEVKDSDYPMNFALFFNKGDVIELTKSFIGYNFFVSGKISKSEELLIQELSNIILNSIVSQISNLAKKVIIPSGPKIIESEKEFIFDVISRQLTDNSNREIFHYIFKIKCREKNIYCEVISFISERAMNKLKVLL